MCPPINGLNKRVLTHNFNVQVEMDIQVGREDEFKKAPTVIVKFSIPAFQCHTLVAKRVKIYPYTLYSIFSCIFVNNSPFS